MKQIIAFVPKNKEKQLIGANKKYCIPIHFVKSLNDLEKLLDGFAVFYPPLVSHSKKFISLLRKYPSRTFNPICDFYVLNFFDTMFLEKYKDLLPDNPDTPEKLIKRFLGMLKKQENNNDK